MKYANTILLALSIATILTGCSKKEVTPQPVPNPQTPSYTVPTSYNFANADFSSSTQRILMLGEITNYLKSAHTSTQSTQPVLNSQKLKDMYDNANGSFSDASLNSSAIRIRDKTSNQFSYQTLLEANFEDAAAASAVSAVNPTVSTASNGVKGKLISPARAILVDANGFEYKEFAEKGIMGAVFYYQAMTLLKTINTFDNTTIVNGSTAQEKVWDESFGYFGVPVSFPTSTVGLKNWGSYCNAVNPAISSNTEIMNAFLKGRAAISNKDNAGRDAARDIVVATWEKVAAAKCVNYLKGAKNNVSDPATLHHNLSEGFGFITALQYNPAKKISDADIALLLSYIGDNLYDITISNLDNAISKLATVYGLDASKL